MTDWIKLHFCTAKLSGKPLLPTTNANCTCKPKGVLTYSDMGICSSNELLFHTKSLNMSHIFYKNIHKTCVCFSKFFVTTQKLCKIDLHFEKTTKQKPIMPPFFNKITLKRWIKRFWGSSDTSPSKPNLSLPPPPRATTLPPNHCMPTQKTNEQTNKQIYN